MTKWEYRAASVQGDNPADATMKWVARLNELGAEGWELVSERFVGHWRENVQPQEWGFYDGTFKRPLE